jgi:hypothetical protein
MVVASNPPHRAKRQLLVVTPEVPYPEAVMQARSNQLEQSQLLREQSQTLRDELTELRANSQVTQDESRQAQERSRVVRDISRELVRERRLRLAR